MHVLSRLVDLQADERLSMPLGNVTLLCGGTISIKDNFAVMDEPVKGCSKILSGYIAPNDSTVAERLKVQNAVILGRVCTDLQSVISLTIIYFDI